MEPGGSLRATAVLAATPTTSYSSVAELAARSGVNVERLEQTEAADPTDQLSFDDWVRIAVVWGSAVSV
jgi:hypothetical protein